jgi:hypothetical protein
MLWTLAEIRTGMRDYYGRKSNGRYAFENMGMVEGR